MAYSKEEWEQIRSAADAWLTTHASLFEQVRSRVEPLWWALCGHQAHTRKPSYHLRLLSEDTHTLVGISPMYSSHTKKVDGARMILEGIDEVTLYLTAENPKPFYQLRRTLQIQLTPEARPSWRMLRASAPADGARLLPVLQQFLDDPASVLKRSSMYCVICGRHLTDGQSRARGIGPECVRGIAFLGSEVSTFGFMEQHAYEEADGGAAALLQQQRVIY